MLTFSHSLKSENKKKTKKLDENKFKNGSQDRRGHYDLDGVSYDGENVYVIGGYTEELDHPQRKK